MDLRGPVLCATDLSDAADAAIRQAHRIATEIGAAMHVCHVLPEVFSVRVLFPQQAGVDPGFQKELTTKATAAVRQRLATIIGDEASSIAVEIDAGTPHAGILGLAESTGAGIIVIGAGSTALQVARSAAVPVLVARPSPTGGAVLGATDFSDPSLPAVSMAAAEARRRSLRFRIVHCLDIDQTSFAANAAMPGSAGAWPLPQAVIDQLESTAQQRLDAALAHTGVGGEALLLKGPPASGIVHAAVSTATTLIVVGTRGRTGLARLALGSVAESVIKHAPCSVLVVPLHPA